MQNTQLDPTSFRPSGSTEATTFGRLFHGTVNLDGRRVPAALSHHWNGERRLIARNTDGKYVSAIVERGTISRAPCPVEVTWLEHLRNR